MNTAQQQTVTEEFCRVMTTMAFMFPEPLEKTDIPTLCGVWHLVSMSFDGPLKGTLKMALPEQLCTQICANVIGLDLDNDKAIARAKDAALEVLNVTCGRILIGLAGKEPIFNLSVPTISAPAEHELKALLDNPSTVAFSAENQTLMLSMSLEKAAA
jgi:hypothetical protein